MASSAIHAVAGCMHQGAAKIVRRRSGSLIVRAAPVQVLRDWSDGSIDIVVATIGEASASACACAQAEHLRAQLGSAAAATPARARARGATPRTRTQHRSTRLPAPLTAANALSLLHPTPPPPPSQRLAWALTGRTCAGWCTGTCRHQWRATTRFVCCCCCACVRVSAASCEFLLVDRTGTWRKGCFVAPTAHVPLLTCALRLPPPPSPLGRRRAAPGATARRASAW